MKEYRVITKYNTEYEPIAKIHITSKQYSLKECCKMISSAIRDITFGELGGVDVSENYEAKVEKSDIKDYDYAIVIYKTKTTVSHYMQVVSEQTVRK